MIARHTPMPHPRLQRTAHASWPSLMRAGEDNLVMPQKGGPSHRNLSSKTRHLVAPVKQRSWPRMPALSNCSASVIFHKISISPTILTARPFTTTANPLSIGPLPSPTKAQNISTFTRHRKGFSILQ
ncbi:hypothetical protein ACHAW6_001359 [Cyclotella cf. meneghiniana]